MQKQRRVVWNILYRCNFLNETLYSRFLGPLALLVMNIYSWSAANDTCRDEIFSRNGASIPQLTHNMLVITDVLTKRPLNIAHTTYKYLLWIAYPEALIRENFTRLDACSFVPGYVRPEQCSAERLRRFIELKSNLVETLNVKLPNPFYFLNIPTYTIYWISPLPRQDIVIGCIEIELNSSEKSFNGPKNYNSKSIRL